MDYYILHAYKSPLKGSIRKFHKWIERTGSPGAYKYVYKDDAKADKNGNNATTSANAASSNDTDLATKPKGINLANKTVKNLLSYKIPGFKNLNAAGSNATYEEKIDQIRSACSESNDNGAASWFDPKDPRYNNGNCVSVASAYLMRRDGYDVQAQVDKGFGFGNTIGLDDTAVELMFKDAKFSNYYNYSTMLAKDSKGQKEILDLLRSQGDGARGFVGGFYDPSLGGGGHQMAYEIVDGKVIIIDGQIGEVFEEDEIFTNPNSMLGYMNSVDYAQICDKGGKNSKQPDTSIQLVQHQGVPQQYPEGLISAMLEPAQNGEFHRNNDGNKKPETETKTPETLPINNSDPDYARRRMWNSGTPTETASDETLRDKIIKNEPSEAAKKLIKNERRFITGDSLIGLGVDALLSNSKVAQKRMYDYDMDHGRLTPIGRMGGKTTISSSTSGNTTTSWSNNTESIPNDPYVLNYLADKGIRYYDKEQNTFWKNSQGDNPVRVSYSEIASMIEDAMAQKRKDGF